MRAFVKYILVFLLSVNSALAQDIHYQLHVKNSDCNGANNGAAEVSVTETHPPYSYAWSSGNSGNSATGLAAGTYSVTVTDYDGNDTVIHFSIIEIPCKIGPAIVLTPNGDGHNDTWAIDNIEFYPDNLILIYNRWGQKVYEHRGAYEPWDGRDLFGVPVPDNSYFYIIYGDKKDEKSIVKGSVSVIR